MDPLLPWGVIEARWRRARCTHHVERGRAGKPFSRALQRSQDVLCTLGGSHAPRKFIQKTAVKTKFAAVFPTVLVRMSTNGLRPCGKSTVYMYSSRMQTAACIESRAHAGGQAFCMRMLPPSTSDAHGGPATCAKYIISLRGGALYIYKQRAGAPALEST